jgi:hypothetical protein
LAVLLPFFAGAIAANVSERGAMVVVRVRVEIEKVRKQIWVVVVIRAHSSCFVLGASGCYIASVLLTGWI